MPTYSYRCDPCNFEFERVQRMTEDAIRECPQCHKDTVRRQISQGNFILKGGGWYSDLYASGSNRKTEAAASSTSTTDGSATASAASTAATAGATGAAASAPVSVPAAGGTGSGSSAPPTAA